MSRRVYVRVPYFESDDARDVGAKWDRSQRSWYMPPDEDEELFRKWLPGGLQGPVKVPETFPAKLAAYYLNVLQYHDIDEMGAKAPVLDGVTFRELDRGQLEGRGKVLADFWKEAQGRHEKSSFPLAPDSSWKTHGKDGNSDLAGVIVTFGWKAGEGRGAGRHVLLALPALLSEGGVLVAAAHRPPIVNPAHFEPQERRRRPVVGDREILEARMEEESWVADRPWQEAWQAANEFFRSVTRAGVALDGFRPEDAPRPSVWLVAHEQYDESVVHLRALYNQLSFDKADRPRLFHEVCEGREPLPLLSMEEQRDRACNHTGHTSGRFGLDPSQREVLRHAVTMPSGSVLAVSGPPGTGKTACLQGIIATAFVNSALESEGMSAQPPVIVACAATNQAVTNIINSFSALSDPEDADPLSRRWLSGIRSYGWYFASRSAGKDDAAAGYQILGRDGGTSWRYDGGAAEFGTSAKDREALEGLAGEYLRAYRERFPEEADVTLERASHALLERLRALGLGDASPFASADAVNLPGAVEAARKLAGHVEAGGLTRRLAAQSRLARKKGRDRRLGERHGALTRAVRDLERDIGLVEVRARDLRSAVGRSEASARGWFLRLWRWRRRRLEGRHRRMLQGVLEPMIGIGATPEDGRALLAASDEVLGSLEVRRERAVRKVVRFERRRDRILEAERQWLAGAEADAAHVDTMQAQIERLRGLASFMSEDRARSWLAGLEAGLREEAADDDLEAERGGQLGRAIAEGGAEAASAAFVLVDELLDRTLRRRCFDLSARYWEARWLLESRRADRGEESLAEGLRRHCMLAPVVVSTVNLLPGLFRSKSRSAELTLGLADLLIIDEAGQVAPAMSVGLFALAKKALVVGDIEQLKPIWNVDAFQDGGLLQQSGLKEAARELEGRGLRASAGSAMLAAQHATRYSATGGRGITLLRHYRCRPTIIEFCNRLVYDRLRPLIPMTREDAGRLFHPMTFVECEKGHASRENGSVVNRAEADELIDWLVENRVRIEEYYNRPAPGLGAAEQSARRDIADLVGIVTPFAEHAGYLRTTLERRFREAGKADARAIVQRMRLGTVHRLQGAERPVVLFSATNSPDDGGRPFIDSNRDMLNVAVSRAQDHFVLFGHPGLFFSPAALKAGNHLPSAVLGRYMKTHGRRLYPRRVVVVESPGKATAVQAALGKDCRVEATSGHFREIRQLDVERARVTWRIVPDKEAMVSRMARLLEEVDELVLATDDDREGDAIAWHLVEALGERVPLDGVWISRMMFHEITDDAVRAAFDDRSIWKRSLRAEAAVTRAIVDKAIGEIMTSEVNRRMQKDGQPGGHAVGRVRAALLRLIAENEERVGSGPREEFAVRGEVGRGGAGATFWITESEALEARAMRFGSREEADRAAQAVRSAKAPELRHETKRYWLGPATPAGTAEVLIAAYEEFGLAPQDTYRILQDLYEGKENAA